MTSAWCGGGVATGWHAEPVRLYTAWKKVAGATSCTASRLPISTLATWLAVVGSAMLTCVAASAAVAQVNAATAARAKIFGGYTQLPRVGPRERFERGSLHWET